MKVIRILIYIALSIVCTALSAQQKEYENPRVTGVNRESGRATFWYYSDRTEALKGGYENTPDNILLNGKWKFHFCEKPAERLVDFTRQDSMYRNGTILTYRAVGPYKDTTSLYI